MIVFLLLGAIVNVAIAWGCALWQLPKPEVNTIKQNKLLSSQYSQFIPISVDDRVSEFGWDNSNAAGEHYEMSEFWSNGPGLVRKSVNARSSETGNVASAALQVITGWPSLALFGERWVSSSVVGQNLGQPRLIAAISAPHEISRGGLYAPRLIPLRPLWPGFAINTIFYAAILWVLFAAPFAFRRWRRVRRGLCAACAYDLRSGGVEHHACPECGAAVSSAA